MTLPRIYVSGPMTGHPEYNYPAFHAASRKLRAAGFEVSSPAEVGLPCGCPPGKPEHGWTDYLRADLVAMLRSADAIATLPGFELSRGAALEIHVGRALGWTVQPVGFWLGEALLTALEPGALLRARPEVPPPPPEYRISNPSPAA